MRYLFYIGIIVFHIWMQVVAGFVPFVFEGLKFFIGPASPDIFLMGIYAVIGVILLYTYKLLANF